MIFITIEDAERILGADFADTEAEKKRLVRLSNVWMTNSVCECQKQYEDPSDVPEALKESASEIIVAIKLGSVYSGVERATTSERVKADSVEVQETYADGSVAISSEEQVALAIIDAECQCSGSAFGFDLWRVVG